MSKITPKNLKIGDAVCVEWEDAYGCSPDWENLPSGDQDIAGIMCRSLGWMVGKKTGFRYAFPAHIRE